MRFTVVQPSRDRCTHPWCFTRIEAIHIEAKMNPVTSLSCHSHRLFDNPLDSQSVYIMHCEAFDSMCSNLLFLILINIPQPDVHQIGRINKWTNPRDMG
ncbi:hypothetical protein D3C76_1592220 [compost metagenome]